VTVEHAFGETTIEQAPTRVATVSWVNADVSIALGVVPVGMPRDDWGGNEQGSTPWKDAALEEAGAAIGTADAPVQYDETDGIDVTAIAALAPDVILGAYSGLTQEEYDTLSKIAPVVAYPDTAYGTAWQDSTRLIGEALGRSDAAEELVEQTEQPSPTRSPSTRLSRARPSSTATSSRPRARASTSTPPPTTGRAS
jgi:iron complex transport system substrate-binding protein